MVSGWQSTISGPIPPHPYYDTRPQSDYVEKSNSHTRPEAQAIADAHRGTVSNVYKTEGTVFSSCKHKPKPRNQLAANVRRMRQIQALSREKEESQPKPTPVKALWKSTKYDHIQSKVVDVLQQRAESSPRPESTNFLRAHSRNGAPIPSRCNTPRSARSSTPPPGNRILKSSSVTGSGLIRRDIDFITANGMGIKNYGIRRSPSATALDEQKTRREELDKKLRPPSGQIPKYLEKRKQQWRDDEEQRVASIPDPDLPEGHKVMPSEERRETLGALEKSREQLVIKLNSLSITSDTLRVKNTRSDIERKISEVDEALRIFSKPKVFVKID